MKKQYTFEEFTEIIRMLRSENGCPWDKEQTHNSLKPCMTEEAAELLAAIRIYDTTGNYENMREELGDILLQVVMHSRIASEEGLFSIDDVITEVSEKMIRRHPHVFGTVKADTSDEVLSNWDDIKKKEKESQSWGESPLRDIPIELPALVRAVKVLKKQDKLYEKTLDSRETLAMLKDVIKDMENILEEPYEDKAKFENCYAKGLLLWSNIAMKNKISPEQVLTDEIEEIIDKYEPKNGKLP
ncbi:MAG: MazG family protein [Lachnospiraceae bacterium]|nr:MazG family protein [Lachnospiraceae bacterium]